MDTTTHALTYGPLFIAVIGSPASGKSTISARLAEAFGGVIIRPRDAIRAALAHEPGLHPLFTPINEMGWFADGGLGVAVRAALARVPPGCRAVVLENLPGDMPQVADVFVAARGRGAKLVIVRLEADAQLLLHRGITRRVCQSRERDSATDPHQPAIISSDDTTLCGQCRHPLATRPDDSPGVLTDRTVRHRRYAQGVLKMAAALDIPVVEIDAAESLDDVTANAIEAVIALSIPLPRGA